MAKRKHDKNRRQTGLPRPEHRAAFEKFKQEALANKDEPFDPAEYTVPADEVLAEVEQIVKKHERKR
jgi:hypothetical protein